MKPNNNTWDIIINPKTSLLSIDLKAIWRYRDLLVLMVHRDFVAVYKQTILGPIWFFIQPILTTLVFTVIFGRVAKIPTDGIPQVLFYMAGITAWGYFSQCLNKTSNTFAGNASIFGKVYFPRLIVPLSIVVSNLLTFGIQFLLFLGFFFYYWSSGANVHPNLAILFTPVLLLLMAGLGLGFGLILSALTTKYRDLKHLVGFGVQLFMYATPIVYPLSLLEGKTRTAALLNPMTSIIETFKYAYLGEGTVELTHMVYSVVFTVILLFTGLLIFHKVEKTFMDTV